MKIYKILMIISLLSLLFSCSDGIVSELPSDENNIKIRANYASIQKEIFDNYCISCHSGAFASGNLDLSFGVSYDNIFNKPNSIGSEIYVKPGRSDDSYIIHRLSDNSQIMPPTGAIDQYLIDTLKVWIDQGAINN